MKPAGRSQPALVGRQRELTLLAEQFAVAAGGSTRVALLAGEPDIGKTRLLDEVAARAGQAGALVLRGGASEAEGMPPYLPFLEALGAYIRAAPPDRLREQAGPAAPVLAGILPELGKRLGTLPPSYPLPPDQARLRLYEAVGAFLVALTYPLAPSLSQDWEREGVGGGRGKHEQYHVLHHGAGLHRSQRGEQLPAGADRARAVAHCRPDRSSSGLSPRGRNPMKNKTRAPLFLAAGLPLCVLAGLLIPVAAAREDVHRPGWASPAAALRLSPEFRISNPTSPECPRHASDVAYNWVQREYLVVWRNWWSSSYQDIYARRVTSIGELASWFAVAAGGNARFDPALAYNATNGEYLVVYAYDASGDGIHYEVWGRRVAWNGSWIGPEFQIFTCLNRSFWTPRVAWNSYRNEYLVVASAVDTTTDRYNDVAGRRVMANGTTPYPGHNISSQSQTLQPHQADVTYNLAADEYLVVWRRYYSGVDWDIWGARVRGDNDAVVTPPGEFCIDDTPVDQDYPAVATNQQDRYLVVWQHGNSLPTTDWNVYGRELDVTGGGVGAHFSILSTSSNDRYPAVAINGATNERFVICWQEATFGIWSFAWKPSSSTSQFCQITPNAAWASPAVASGSPGYLVVYDKSEGTALHIWGRVYWPEAVYLPLTLKNK